MKKKWIVFIALAAILGASAAAFGVTYAAYSAETETYEFDGSTNRFTTFSVAHYFHGGTGTAEDPYLIANAIEMRNLSKLQAMGLIPSESGESILNHFELKNSFTWSGAALSPIGADSTHAWKGVFKGGGKSIHGMKINVTGSYAGVFGYVDGGTVQDILLSAPTLTTSGASTAGFIVGNIASGTVTKLAVFGGTSNIKCRAKLVLGGATTSASAIVGAGSSTYISFVSSGGTVNWPSVTSRTYSEDSETIPAGTYNLWLNGSSVENSN